MAKYYNSTFYLLRSKEDADEFQRIAIEEWDTTAKNYPFPPELSEATVQLVMRIWKRKKVMWINPETEEKQFYQMHNFWKNKIIYGSLPEDTY